MGDEGTSLDSLPFSLIGPNWDILPRVGSFPLCPHGLFFLQFVVICNPFKILEWEKPQDLETSCPGFLVGLNFQTLLYLLLGTLPPAHFSKS